MKASEEKERKCNGSGDHKNELEHLVLIRIASTPAKGPATKVYALTVVFRSLRRHKSWIGRQANDVNTARKKPCKEEEEVSVVPVANAIIHPRTVVVHGENTLARDMTMVRTRRLVFFAFTTPAETVPPKPVPVVACQL